MTSRVTTAHFRQALALDSHRPHLPTPLACAGGSRDTKSQHTGIFWLCVFSTFPLFKKDFFSPTYCKVRENILFLDSLKWRTWHKRNVARLNTEANSEDYESSVALRDVHTGQLRKPSPKKSENMPRSHYWPVGEKKRVLDGLWPAGTTFFSIRRGGFSLAVSAYVFPRSGKEAH